MKHIFLLTISASLFFCGCSSSKKFKEQIKTSDTVKIDSTSSSSIDTSHVVKDNTVSTKEKENTYTKETTIEFNQTSSDTATRYPERYMDKPEDYFQKNSIKKITIKETGIKKEKETETKNIVDSSVGKIKNDVAVNKEEKHETSKTTKSKSVFRFSWWWLLLLLIPAVIYWKRKWIAGLFGMSWWIFKP